MRPTPEQILSFLDKANEIRDIHEVLPSNDPEARDKAIVDAFDSWFGAKWQPIETAPRHGEHILLLTTRGMAIAGHGLDDYSNNPKDRVGKWWAITSGHEARDIYGNAETIDDATHWMPLPDK